MKTQNDNNHPQTAEQINTPQTGKDEPMKAGGAVKTLNQIRIAKLRAGMRQHAMDFRDEVSPRNFEQFSERMARAVVWLDLAKRYHDMALTREAK